MGHRMRLEAPTDVRRTLSVLRRGRGDPTFQQVGDTLWRATRLTTGPVTMRLDQRGPDELEVDAWGDGADELLETVTSWFPADEFGTAPLPHPVVADAHRRFPLLRTPRTGRVVEALVAGIIEQKVVGQDAFAGWRRIIRQHGTPAPGDPPLPLWVPPDPAGWVAIPSWDWHRAGVDPKRYRTIQAATRVGEQLERVAARGDLATTYRALRSLPGIGAWTAGEVGARALGDPDAVSWGDYHLGHTVGTGLSGDRDATDDDVAVLLEPFRPYRGRVVRLIELSPLVAFERRGARMSRVDHRNI